MTPPKLPVACPRCSFTIELNADRVAQGPITRTCPACGLLFRVGRGSESEYPQDPVYETSSGWYLRKADGTVLYFPDLKVLQIWSSDGMVSLTDEISKKGVDWKRVHDLPEFASLAVSAGSPKDSTAVLPRPSQYAEDGQGTGEILTELDFIDPTSGRRSGLYISLAFIIGSLGTWFLVGVMSSNKAPNPPPSPPPAEAPAAVIASPKPDGSEDVTGSEPVALSDAGPETQDTSQEQVVSDDSKDGDDEEKDVDGVEKVEAPPKPRKPRRTRRNNRPSTRGLSYDKLMSLGNSQLRTNPSKAARTFMKALQMRDATSEARAKLGRAYLRSGNLRDAIYHLEKAINDNPKYRPALKDLAAAYTQRGSREDAIRVLRQLQRMVGRHSQDYRWVKRQLSALGAN